MMNNRCIYTVLFSVLVCSVKAQKIPSKLSSHALSTGVQVGVPFASKYDYRIAPEWFLKYELPTGRNFSLFAHFGLAMPSYKDASIGTNTQIDEYVTFKLGGRYFFNKRWYAEAEGGGLSEFAERFGEDRRSNKSALSYAGGSGVIIPFIGNRFDLDLGLRYEGWTKGYLQQIGFRAAFRIRYD